jgi:hypothetical protein
MGSEPVFALPMSTPADTKTKQKIFEVLNKEGLLTKKTA